ncbi:MAG: translation initiation factor eIF-2B subunit [Candidatus Aenigmatarchaeota archaeon]
MSKQLTLDDFVHELKALHIQGAKQIAVESLKFLKQFVKQKGFGRTFDVACNKIEAARPTAVPLHNVIETVKKERSIETIDRLLAQLQTTTKRIAAIGSKIIKPGWTIMTHCHSGEALAVMKAAWAQGKKIHVIATETEPVEQGIRTVKELRAVKIPVTLITDAAAGFFMSQCDAVIVGCDALRMKEGLINKTGTYPMALLARAHRKPFYTVASTFKLDRRKRFIIEERPPKEVYRELHELHGASVRNPAFDITPWNLITRVITEKGVMTPGNVKRLLK